MIDTVIDREVRRQKGAARRPPLFLDDLPANGTERGHSLLPSIASICPAVFGRRSAFSLAGDGSLTPSASTAPTLDRGACVQILLHNVHVLFGVCSSFDFVHLAGKHTHTEKKEI